MKSDKLVDSAFDLVKEADSDASSVVAVHNADTTAVHGITDTSALETTTGAQAKVDAHESDTTAVHGITDTSALETTTGSQAKVDAHESDTTAVHGITDTSALETTTGAQSKADAAQAAAVQRANHTGTQLANTVSDFDTAVSANSDVTANSATTTEVTNARTFGKTDQTPASLSARLAYLDNVYNVVAYGAAGDGVTDDSAALQAAIDASEDGLLFVPEGVYAFSTTLEMPAAGLRIMGAGSSDRNTSTELKYTGSGNAIEDVAGALHAECKLYFSDFSLTGTASATGGINISVGYLYGGSVFERLRVDGFTSGFGVTIEDGYGFHFKDSVVRDCQDGIIFSGTSIGNLVQNCWVRNCTRYGIHANITAENLAISKCTIDSSTSQPSGQRGVYVQAGQVFIDGCHFEDLYQHFKIEEGICKVVDCYFADVGTINSAIDDDIFVHLRGLIGNINNQIDAGRGTFWEQCNLQINAPTQTAVDNIDYPATILNFSPSSSHTLRVIKVSARFHTGPITLVFGNDDTTVEHNASGYGNGYFILAKPFDWSPKTGDTLTLIQGGDDGPYYEVGRTQSTLAVTLTSGSRDVELGEYGTLFSNNGASGVVTWNLPDTSAATVGLILGPFVRVSDYDVRIDPYSTEVIRGASAGGKYLQIDTRPGSVTLVNDANAGWTVVGSTGTLSFEA